MGKVFDLIPRLQEFQVQESKRNSITYIILKINDIFISTQTESNFNLINGYTFVIGTVNKPYINQVFKTGKILKTRSSLLITSCRLVSFKQLAIQVIHIILRLGLRDHSKSKVWVIVNSIHNVKQSRIIIIGSALCCTSIIIIAQSPMIFNYPFLRKSVGIKLKGKICLIHS